MRPAPLTVERALACLTGTYATPEDELRAAEHRVALDQRRRAAVAGHKAARPERLAKRREREAEKKRARMLRRGQIPAGTVYTKTGAAAAQLNVTGKAGVVVDVTTSSPRARESAPAGRSTSRRTAASRGSPPRRTSADDGDPPPPLAADPPAAGGMA
jgi:hypothetical protein